MGVLSSNIKPSFLGLLKFLNNMNWIIVFFSLINFSMCIYEDQIGKFDWHQSYVGRIKFAQFDTVSTAKKIIVATEENVLAALNLKTGQVVWRHVFESASTAGNIRLLHVGEKVTTVTGSNPYVVRGWNSDTGVLLWEWALTLQDDKLSKYSQWWVQNNMLVHLLPVFGQHIEVTMYNLVTGSNRGATSKLPSVWNNEGCVLTAPYYTCISGEIKGRLLISIDVTSEDLLLISKELFNYIDNEQVGGYLKGLNGNSAVPGFIIDEKEIVLIKDNSFEKLTISLNPLTNSAAVVEGSNGYILIQTWTDDTKGFTLTGHSVTTGKEVSEICVFDDKVQIPEPELLAVMCTLTQKEQQVCRMLINGVDDAVHLMLKGGRVLWTREEALANVVAAEFVDLPISETEAALESEFDQKEAAKVYSSVWSAFYRRLHTQYQQLLNMIRNFQGEGAVQKTNSLVRDYFNLHKIIVLVTDAGKIFGMDNLSGDILWMRYEPSFDPENVAIFARGTARHPPYDVYLSIVGKHEETGNGYIISLNPIRGTLVGERILQLDTRLLQCTLLQVADEEKLHALVLLDEDENVQVLPLSARSLVQNIYMYVAKEETGNVQGYALLYNGKDVIAQRTWSVQLGGSSPATIVATATRSRLERVRSPGKALADRSVLYKYSNPNLVLFVLEKEDPTYKEVVTAVVLDAVTGVIVGASSHRRARALPLAVHADNCFAYLYRSDKQRRIEVATMEFYEGKERWLEAGTPFSSQLSYRTPAMERQAYIMPAALSAAAFTTTERSLTDRHLLLALNRGAIIEMPWAYLEARRDIGGLDEVVLPYTPELPLLSESIINYNKTVQRVNGVYTAPSGLESTSLVLVTGLDIYYTRVAPSKSFDLLKDDFDYFLIITVLAALISATYGTRYFVSRKMLKMAWK